MTRTERIRKAANRVAKGQLKLSSNSRLRRFKRDEDGAMIIFGVMMFGLMLAIGGLSFDIMRYEAHRERLQSTLDRATLAAASLTQSADPKTVVLEYFAKAGMSDYIDPSDITVTEGLNSRRVDATAYVHVPLHHGNFEIFSDPSSPHDNVLIAKAHSIAQESIGNVEISLVLDVSGSMGSYSRLTNLKTAAKGFLDTIYDAAEPNSVSTSIVPYSTQVNAGATLLSYFQRTDSHEHSHCLNFASADFNSTSMSLVTDYEQTLHFDPWTDERDSWWDVGEDNADPSCYTEDELEIEPWSTNKAALKTYIDGFTHTDNTSTDIGTKWGAALLDPSLRTVLTGMIASNDIVPELAGRPFDYSSSDAMKIMIVMTDGANTSQYYMDDYRDGDSFVWRYQSGNDIYYSIWHDGEGSTPDVNKQTTTENQIVGYNSTWVCTNWHWYWGYCTNGYWDHDPIYEEVEVTANNWFIAYNTAIGSGGDTEYTWKPTPHDGDNNFDEGAGSATRMTWDEVWAEIPPEYFSDEILYEMDTLTSTERNAYEDAISSKGQSTKDTRFDNICTATKAQGVIIFTIGLEVSNSNATRLTNCASTALHYFDVDNLDIDDAFQSIAASINQLRLVQ